MTWLNSIFGKTSLLVQKAFAASGDPGAGQSVTLPNPLNLNTFQDLWNVIMSAVFWLAVPVTTAMVLWGAFQIITAGGDAEKVKSGGKSVLYAAIGFGLVVLAQGATYLIEDIIKTTTGS